METDDYSLWTAGGTLLLIAPQVPPAQRQAVLDSLLYAQLLANKVVGSRFTLYPSWYARYRQVLSERGWITTQSFYDTQSANGCSLIAPIQPVRLWLDSQFPMADNLIEYGLATLKKTQNNLDNFRHFTFEGHESGTRVALEVGLVHPGPVINLCSIALQTSEQVAHVSIEGPLLAKALQSDVVVKGLSAQLDNQQFEPQRGQLRALIERKQQEQCYLSNLGRVQGGNHE
ncbi:hypothetical protein [Pseudomonas sp.]|uniref:hypothetical protein n=1 Tax=Pseudomonas sp. TaxID=306 RepID=UPI003D0CD381